MEEERAGRDEGAEVVRAEAGLPLTGRQCTEGFLPGDATLGEVGRFRRPNAARSRFCEAPKAGGVAEAERRAGAAGGRGLSRSRSSAAGQVLRWAARFRRARGALTSGVPPLPSHTHTHTHARTHARTRQADSGRRFRLSASTSLLEPSCWTTVCWFLLCYKARRPCVCICPGRRWCVSCLDCGDPCLHDQTPQVAHAKSVQFFGYQSNPNKAVFKKVKEIEGCLKLLRDSFTLPPKRQCSGQRAGVNTLPEEGTHVVTLPGGRATQPEWAQGGRTEHPWAPCRVCRVRGTHVSPESRRSRRERRPTFPAHLHLCCLSSWSVQFQRIIQINQPRR